MAKRRAIILAGLAWFMTAHAQADPAPGDILARSGNMVYTREHLADVLTIDQGVLETPLSDEERAEIQKIVVAEFLSDPAAIVRIQPSIHWNAQTFRAGNAVDQATERETHWEAVLRVADKDRFVASWLAIMRAHAHILAEGGGMVVTQQELDAMLTSDDIVATAAGQPLRSPAERAAMAAGLKDRFAAMSPAEQATYAHAERRMWALRQYILSYSDLRAKAIGLIRAAVHGPGDVGPEARRLEDEGMKFDAIMRRNMAQAGQIMGMQGKLNATQGIDFATRKFWGQGP